MSELQYEEIKDVNGNSVIPGDRLLIFSAIDDVPFYVVVYRNADKRLCVQIKDEEWTLEALIHEDQQTYEPTIPVFDYEFTVVHLDEEGNEIPAPEEENK